MSGCRHATHLDRAGVVWNRGRCRARYGDANGKNFTLWPTHTFTVRKQTERFDAGAYELRIPARAEGGLTSDAVPAGASA